MGQTLRQSRSWQKTSINELLSSFVAGREKAEIKFLLLAGARPDPINPPVLRRQTSPIQVSSREATSSLRAMIDSDPVLTERCPSYMRHMYGGMTFFRDVHVILHESELQPRQPWRRDYQTSLRMGWDNSPQ
jgi:hypothetical protein